MKTTVLTTVIVLGVAMLAALWIGCSRRTTDPGVSGKGEVSGIEKPSSKSSVQPADDAVLTEYEYMNVGMMWPPEHYRLTRLADKEGRYELLCSSPNVSVCDIVEVDAEVAQQVSQMVLRYGLLDLANGYSMPSDIEVLDGYRWELTVRYNDGTMKLTSGRNAEPDTKGFYEIGKYLGTVAKEAGGEWKEYNGLVDN